MLGEFELERIVFHLISSQVFLNQNCCIFSLHSTCLVDDSNPLCQPKVLLDHSGSPVSLQKVIPTTLFRNEISPILLDSSSRSLHPEVLFIEADHFFELSQRIDMNVSHLVNNLSKLWVMSKCQIHIPPFLDQLLPIIWDLMVLLQHSSQLIVLSFQLSWGLVETTCTIYFVAKRVLLSFANIPLHLVWQEHVGILQVVLLMPV